MRYALKIQWHFFASGHGKGVVDGIGATVKGTVWRRIIAGKLVKTAKDVADTPEQYCPGVHIMYVPAEDILDNAQDLQEHWQGVKTIPNTLRLHSFNSIAPYVVEVHEESGDDCQKMTYLLRHFSEQT